MGVILLLLLPSSGKTKSTPTPTNWSWVRILKSEWSLTILSTSGLRNWNQQMGTKPDYFYLPQDKFSFLGAAQVLRKPKMSKTLVSRLRLRPWWSQGRSQALRPLPEVSVSVWKFETDFKSISISLKFWDHNAKVSVSIVGLAHHRFWNPQRKLISCQLFNNFYHKMCVQGQIKLLFLFWNQ